MKMILFGVSLLISFIGCSLVLIVLTARMEKAAAPVSPIDVTAYYSDKDSNSSKETGGFGVILTTLSLDVLELTATISANELPPVSSPSPVPQQSTKPFDFVYSDPSGSAQGKSQLTVAVLGDSMVDTLGKDLPHLQQELKQRLPQYTFTLHNYGVGASNIEYGLTRLTSGYSYLGDSKPSLLSLNPDVVVVESFAYNHWDNTQSDLDRQWLTIAKIIETIKNNNPNTKIVLATTIAPYCPTYTDGSANLPPERKYVECETVKAYLQNLINFATSQGYPLADAYYASLSGGEGNPKYINQGDHIHASDEGKQLFAHKVAMAISGLLQ